MSTIVSVIRRHPFKSTLVLGTVVGGIWAGAQSTSNSQRAFVNDFTQAEYAENAMRLTEGVRIARSIVSPADTSGLNLRLYQYQTCPFSSKARALLDYYGFNYEVVEVHPITRRQIDFSPYKKVPIVLVRGRENRQLNDSNFIMSLLRSYITAPKSHFDDLISYYPHHKITSGSKTVVDCPNKYFIMFHDTLQTIEQVSDKKNEREWRHWVDDKFIHAISPNVYRTWEESISTFRWFSDVGNWHDLFPAWERILAVYVGAAAMYVISKRLKKRHKISDDERQSLYAYANEWMAGKGDRPFMGGNEPNLADIAMYGSINAFAGCKAYDDMRLNTGIGKWYDAMQNLVNEKHGSIELSKAIAIRKKYEVL